LWTPGYWGWRDGIYAWHAGYWGPHVGFYGGVNYGFGYGGIGYEGGRWDNGVFAYNRTVNNFGSVTVTNVYNKTVINNNITRVSFNGGNGGITARPTPQQQAATQEHHIAPAPAQVQQQHLASTNRALLASENHGRPAIAATAKPGEFTGKGVVAAREAKPGPAPLPQPSTAMAPRTPAAAAAPNNKLLDKRPLANNPAASKPVATNPAANKPLATNPAVANRPLESRSPAGPAAHTATANGALPKPSAAAIRPAAKPVNAAAKPVSAAARPTAAVTPKQPPRPPAAPPRRQVAAAPHVAPHPPVAKPKNAPHNEPR
jgi:hypothetical protein